MSQPTERYCNRCDVFYTMDDAGFADHARWHDEHDARIEEDRWKNGNCGRYWEDRFRVESNGPARLRYCSICDTHYEADDVGTAIHRRQCEEKHFAKMRAKDTPKWKKKRGARVRLAPRWG